MKTGKRMIIANVGLALGPEEKIDYPILLSESLTAVLAVPLVQKSSVWCTIIWSKRWTSFTKIFDNDDIQRKFGIFNDDK